MRYDVTFPLNRSSVRKRELERNTLLI